MRRKRGVHQCRVCVPLALSPSRLFSSTCWKNIFIQSVVQVWKRYLRIFKCENVYWNTIMHPTVKGSAARYGKLLDVYTYIWEMNRPTSIKICKNSLYLWIPIIIIISIHFHSARSVRNDKGMNICTVHRLYADRQTVSYRLHSDEIHARIRSRRNFREQRQWWDPRFHIVYFG